MWPEMAVRTQGQGGAWRRQRRREWGRGPDSSIISPVVPDRGLRLEPGEGGSENSHLVSISGQSQTEGESLERSRPRDLLRTRGFGRDDPA